MPWSIWLSHTELPNIQNVVKHIVLMGFGTKLTYTTAEFLGFNDVPDTKLYNTFYDGLIHSLSLMYFYD